MMGTIQATSLASTAARWGIFPAPKPLPDSRVINVDALWTVRQKALNKKAKKRTVFFFFFFFPWLH